MRPVVNEETIGDPSEPLDGLVLIDANWLVAQGCRWWQ